MAPQTPFLTQIEEKMYELIGAMYFGPYHFTWGSVNEEDVAKNVFPSALIYLEDENNLDDKNGAWGGAYFNEVVYRIEVKAQLDREYSNPVFEINKELNKALDDLKKLFGNNWSLDGATDTIMYIGSKRQQEKLGDILVPSKLITRWLCRYEQSRTSPDELSC
jgi:hypothetical protein